MSCKICGSNESTKSYNFKKKDEEVKWSPFKANVVTTTTYSIYACKKCRHKFTIYKIFGKILTRIFIIFAALFFLIPLLFGIVTPAGILFLILPIITYIIGITVGKNPYKEI